MIKEEILKKAAIEADQAIRDSLPAPEECKHIFSPEFHKKMRRVFRRAKHPIIYKLPKQVACFVLAVVLISGTWLTVDAEARDAFVGWVKELYNTYFVYRFDEQANNSNTGDYRPTWIPSGYEEDYINQIGQTMIIVYVDENGNQLEFDYVINPDETDWFVEISDTEIQQTTVNGNPAELLISQDPENANSIMWTTTDNSAFCISGFLDEKELAKMAESVQPIK